MPLRKLVLTKSFLKAYQKFTKNNVALKTNIEQALRLLEQDTFSMLLKTHKLSGNLFGYYACSCGYDCRIIFSVEKSEKTKQEFILLIDIGTHDEVY